MILKGFAFLCPSFNTFELQVPRSRHPAPPPAQETPQSKAVYIPKVGVSHVSGRMVSKVWACLYNLLPLIEKLRAGILTVIWWQPKRRTGSPGCRWFSCRVNIRTLRTIITRWESVLHLQARQPRWPIIQWNILGVLSANRGQDGRRGAGHQGQEGAT